MKRNGHALRTGALIGAAVIAAVAWAAWARREPVAARERAPHTAAEQSVEPTRAGSAPRLKAAAPRWFGSVRDPSGAPIPGAEVCADCEGRSCGLRRPECTRAGVAGDFVLAELAPGSYRVIASAAGYLPASARRPGRAGEEAWLELGPSGDQRLDVELRPLGVRVRGEVADAAGGPIGGARITLLEAARPGTRLARAETRADGSFDLYTDVGPVVLSVRADGYATALQPIVAPVDSLQIELAPAARMRGRVISAADRAGLPDITLQVRRQTAHAATPPVATAVSDASGHFVVDGLAPGRYRVSAQAAHWFGELAPVDVRIGDESAVTLPLSAAVPVNGRVLIEPARDPCRAGAVTLVESTGGHVTRGAQIAPDGRVFLDGVPSGTYQLEIECTGALRAEYPPLRIAGESPELTWTVRAGARVRGRVVDAAGRGLAQRTVEAAAADGSHALPPSAASTDAQGAFELTGLTAGPYRVSLGDRPGVSQEVNVTAELDPSPLTLVVRDSAAIHVRLTGGGGRSLDAYRVSALRAGAEPEARVAERVASASFSLSELPAGDYELSASDGDNPALVRRLQLRTGETVNVVWNMPAHEAALSGRVLDARGEPVSDAWVRITNGDAPLPLMGDGRAVLTQLDGRFSIGRLDPRARYDLEAHRPPHATVVARGLSPGRPAVLQLPAEPD